jgi:hypothetical protein
MKIERKKKEKVKRFPHIYLLYLIDIFVKYAFVKYRIKIMK